MSRAALMLDAMDSVRAQTYQPIELVIVDDGSTDGHGFRMHEDAVFLEVKQGPYVGVDEKERF